MLPQALPHRSAHLHLAGLRHTGPLRPARGHGLSASILRIPGVPRCVRRPPRRAGAVAAGLHLPRGAHDQGGRDEQHLKLRPDDLREPPPGHPLLRASHQLPRPGHGLHLRQARRPRPNRPRHRRPRGAVSSSGDAGGHEGGEAGRGGQ